MLEKVIVDANILISAYGCDGEVRRYWRDSLRTYKIIVSPEILIEVEARLRNGEFNMPSAAIKAMLLDVLDRCEIVRPNPLRDPKFSNTKDAHLAALALHRYPDDVGPRWLLTGDDALGKCSTIGTCKVIGIGEFCNSSKSELANERH